MDIMLDNDYIPLVESGDFVADDELLQQQKLLLISSKGSFKQYPLAGCGIIDAVNEENPKNIIVEIKRQFKADGLKVNSITLINDEFLIDAERS